MLKPDIGMIAGKVIFAIKWTINTHTAGNIISVLVRSVFKMAMSSSLFECSWFVYSGETFVCQSNAASKLCPLPHEICLKDDNHFMSLMVPQILLLFLLLFPSSEGSQQVNMLLYL